MAKYILSNVGPRWTFKSCTKSNGSIHLRGVACEHVHDGDMRGKKGVGTCHACVQLCCGCSESVWLQGNHIQTFRSGSSFRGCPDGHDITQQ